TNNQQPATTKFPVFAFPPRRFPLSAFRFPLFPPRFPLFPFRFSPYNSPTYGELSDWHHWRKRTVSYRRVYGSEMGLGPHAVWSAVRCLPDRAFARPRGGVFAAA